MDGGADEEKPNDPAENPKLKPQADPVADGRPAVPPPVVPGPPGEPLVTYYEKVEITGEDGFYRLDFHRAENSPPDTPVMRNFQLQIEDVERLVNALFQNEKTRKARLFAVLHMTAYSGLVGNQYSIEVGLDNLRSVKNRIADSYPLIREPIWWANLRYLIGMVLVCAAASGVSRYFVGSWLPPTDQAHPGGWLIISAFAIPLGCLIGLFAEFLFRVNDDIPYEQLRAINPGRWKVGARAFNTIVVAFIFAACLAGNILQIGLSGTLLNEFEEGRPELSLAIGFITGFAFPYVRDLLQQIRPERRLPTA